MAVAWTTSWPAAEPAKVPTPPLPWPMGHRLSHQLSKETACTQSHWALQMKTPRTSIWTLKGVYSKCLVSSSKGKWPSSNPFSPLLNEIISTISRKWRSHWMLRWKGAKDRPRGPAPPHCLVGHVALPLICCHLPPSYKSQMHYCIEKGYWICYQWEIPKKWP